MKLFFIYFFLLSLPVFGQKSNRSAANIEISTIKVIINSISKDTALTCFTFDKVLNDSLKIPLIKKIETYTAYYSKKNVLEKISVLGSDELFEGRPLTEYYFKEGKIIGIHTKYIDASRMGSLGAIEFNFFLFFNNGKRIGFENLVKKSKSGFCDSCYPHILNEQAILEEINAILKTVNIFKNNSNRK